MAMATLSTLLLGAPLMHRHERGMLEPRLDTESNVTAAVARFTPLQQLECLKRHRYTPLACRDLQRVAEIVALAGLAGRRPADRDKAHECSAQGGHAAVCSHGTGRCAYSNRRGWHCACTTLKLPAPRRGQGRAELEAECVTAEVMA